MRLKIIGQTSDKYTKAGRTVLKAEILEPKTRRKYGYILIGVYLPPRHITDWEDELVFKSQAEAFKKG